MNSQPTKEQAMEAIKQAVAEISKANGVQVYVAGKTTSGRFARLVVIDTKASEAKKIARQVANACGLALYIKKSSYFYRYYGISSIPIGTSYEAHLELADG